MDGGQLDGHPFRLVTFMSLYNKSLYADTAQLWQYAIRSDETGVESQLHGLARDDVGSDVVPAELSPSENCFSVLPVTCNDTKFSGDVSA